MGMTPEQAEAVRLREQGLTHAEVAEAMGTTRDSARSLIKRAKKWMNAPEGIRAATDAAGLDLSSATHGWRVIPRDDGGRDSVFWRNATGPEDVAEAIKAAMADMPALPPIIAPQHCNSDLLTLYPIADAHVGLMAWAKETGEAYDTTKAAERIIEWMGRAVDASPPSKTAIVMDVGDLTHGDDQTNQTPTSKHGLDVDTRHYRTLEVTITAICAAVEYAARKHERVIVVILPGNHNPHSYMAVLFALKERYRDDPRIEVRAKPGEWFVYQFGAVMLAGHHGDKAKPERMVHFIADEFAAIWGKTRYRHLFTGHKHHMNSQDIGGCLHEQLRALTARDAYAASHAYTARAQLSAVTYHRERGEVFRARVAA